MQVRITLFRYNWKILIDFYYVPPSMNRRMDGCWGCVWCLMFGASADRWILFQLHRWVKALCARSSCWPCSNIINCWSNNDKVLTEIDLQQRFNQQLIRLPVLVRLILKLDLTYYRIRIHTRTFLVYHHIKRCYEFFRTFKSRITVFCIYYLFNYSLVLT